MSWEKELIQPQTRNNTQKPILLADKSFIQTPQELFNTTIFVNWII